MSMVSCAIKLDMLSSFGGDIMDFDKLRLGERIYAARSKKGLKQNEVYEKIGLHQSAYSDIENGKRLPSIPLLFDIATILDTSVSYLIGESSSDIFTSEELLEIEQFKKFILCKRNK
jgi:transcriptional regulator with XRE-family HTH domain